MPIKSEFLRLVEVFKVRYTALTKSFDSIAFSMRVGMVDKSSLAQ